MVPNMNAELHINSVVTQRKTEETGFYSRQVNLIFFILKWAQQSSGAQSTSYIKGTGVTFVRETCLCIRVTTYLSLVQKLLTRGFNPQIPRMPELYGAKLSIERTLYLHNFPDDDVFMWR